MKPRIHFGVVMFLGATLLVMAAIISASSWAQQRPTKAELTPGLSRGELFARFVRAPAETDLGILGSALPFYFRFPLHVRNESIFGIDVSYYNEANSIVPIDWNAVANQGVSFVYLKATEGTWYRDNKFPRNWATLGKHPTIHRGAYHFLKAAHDPIDQANAYLRYIGTLSPKDLPPVVDLEWDTGGVANAGDAWDSVSQDVIVDRALKWLAHVENASRRVPMIYTANSWWTRHIRPEQMKLFARYPIWIADYSAKGLGEEKPNVPHGREWTIWQFTEKGLLAQGLPGNVDANIFKGSLEEFRKTFGIVMASAGPNQPNIATNPPTNLTPPTVVPPVVTPTSKPLPKDAAVLPPTNSPAAMIPRQCWVQTDDRGFGYYGACQ